MDSTAVIVVVGGVVVTRFARVGQVRIDDLLNDAPNTAALTLVNEPRPGGPVSGAFAGAFDAGAFQTASAPTSILTPPPIAVGMAIAIYLGTVDPAYLVFGGQITTREQIALMNVPAHIQYNLTCIDWTRRLNARIASKAYAEASATAIVTDLIATFAPTLTTHNVETGLPTVGGGMVFTWESISAALSRLAQAIGAYWFVDYVGDVHFFTGTEAGTDPAPIVPGADFADLKITADLTQVRTRVFVEGDGSTVALDLPAGDAIVPLAAAGAFNAAGGLATLGPARVTYTGSIIGGIKTNTVAAVVTTPPPTAPGAPTVAVAPLTTAGGLVGGPYQYAVTVELADGSRSDLGAVSAPVTIPTCPNPPATSAAFPASPIAGPIRAGVTATYATSYVDAQGNETIATTGGTVLTGQSIPTPPTPGYTVNSPGQVDQGYHMIAASWLTAAGETAAAILNLQIQTVTGQMLIYSPQFPSPDDARVVAARLYRSTTSPTASGPVLPWRRVADVVKGGPAYHDPNADAALAPATLLAVSTADTPQGAIVTVPTSADPRVVKRRLYRSDGGGPYKLVTEIPDNSTGSYTDGSPAAGGNVAPTINRLGSGAVNLTAIPLGPAGTVRRRIFRTAAGGTQYRELTAIADNTTTTYLDTTPDSLLGGAPLAPVGPGGATPPPTAPGATTIQLTDLNGVPPAGWIGVESQTIIRYTGTSTTGGFFLTGIPASGVGAIIADIPAGTVVTTIPALVGVSPVGPVKTGDTVQVLVQVDDTAAQAALAALDGSDGILEYYVQDRRLSEASARARGLAELALFNTVETKLAYTTHDPNTRSGRTVHIDLPAPTNLTGDFLIQKVTIADVSIAKNWYPKRAVEASTTRFSFDDVLARILISQR